MAASSKQPPQPANANPDLFKGVRFFISETVRPDIRAALHDLLTSWGGSPCPPALDSDSSSLTFPRFDLSSLTHFITDTLDFPEYDLLRPDGEPRVGPSGKGKGREGQAVRDEIRVEIVSPAWVTRSFDLQTLQPPRFYSADRALFFSGTVICTSDFPDADNIAVNGAVEAFGGQFRRELTREVTHLICVAEYGPKYEMAMKFGTELGMVVVLPHWFEESLKLAQLVPIDIYRFPSPPFSTTLRDASSTKSFAERLHAYWLAKLAPSAGASCSSSTATSSTPPSATANTATAVILGGVTPLLASSYAAPETDTYLRQSSELEGPSSAFRKPGSLTSASSASYADLPRPLRKAANDGKPFSGKKVYLASDLGLSLSLEKALKGAIEAAGGECWSFGIDGEREERVGEVGGGKRTTDAWARRRAAERKLKDSSVVIMRTREGWEYWTAYDLQVTLGNLSYLYYCLSTSSLPSPLSRLLHYPLPSLDGVAAFKDKVITVSNYAGPARDYVRAMIEVLGARFEGTMGKGTAFVVSASEYGSKVSHARSWHIPLVTHMYLEACILSWSLLSPTLHPSYTLSGTGTSSFTGGASETHFTTILGSTGWTKDVIKKWADREEVRAMRAQALRGVDELEAERLREIEPVTGLGIDVDGIGGKEDGDDEDEAMLPPLPVAPVRATSRPLREDRAHSTLLVSESIAPRGLSTAPSTVHVAPTSEREKTAEPSRPPPKGREDKEKSVEKKSNKPSSTTNGRRKSADTMDVDDGGEEEVRDRPGRLETPRAGGKSKANPPDKRKRSSTLSSADSSSGDDDGSSSSDESPPPSAHRVTESFAKIDAANLVAVGSKRGAAAKAKAMLADAMLDRNKYEAEQRSSHKKKNGGRNSNIGGDLSQRSASPSKKGGARCGRAESEEDQPAQKKKKRPAKEITPKAEDDDGDVDIAPPPAKKKKQAESKPLKVVQASVGGAVTTQGTGGAVSSFDNPPRAKPVPPKANKIRIISTGLGLDKTSPDIKSLKSLGANWTDQPKDATHLVVKGISRTEKFLCCLPFAPKIVTQRWIDACIAAGRLIDEMPYLLHDEKKEKEIDDTLEAILARAKKGKLFAGRNVYVTKNVSPDAATMQRIISACGGIVNLTALSKSAKKIAADEDSLVISCPNDRREWEKLAAAPLKKEIYSVEAIFVSVLHQDLQRGLIGKHSMLSARFASVARRSTGYVRALSTAPAPTLPPSESGLRPPHLLTLADLTVPQLQHLISSSIAFKKHYKSRATPQAGRIEGAQFEQGDANGPKEIEEKTLADKTVALMFSKRSTRTRVASETAVQILGGHPMFLGSGDIQLGVNESLYDTARVVSSMVDGIMARVGHHSEVETLAKHSSVPVINALSHLYHPTQILADLQTLLEIRTPFTDDLSSLEGLTISWVGDSNNILNEMMVVYPRLGVNLQIATPKGYDLDAEVLERANAGIKAEGGKGKIIHTHSPEEAVKGAHVVTTDTWISMGQEEESARRLKDFAGYQVTNELLARGGADKDVIFMHCLPRHKEEVDDEVFYGNKSVVFQEAENRKWTILAVFDAFIGRWKI
ncbi:hypothetical protein JCM11251_002412 [Rhodosporidiobolus azoricus]